MKFEAPPKPMARWKRVTLWIFGIWIALGALGSAIDGMRPKSEAELALEAQQAEERAARAAQDAAIAEAEAARQAEERLVQQAQERAAEEACRQDIQCWGDKFSLAAASKCDDQVERLANFSSRWTDGFLEPKFSHFRWRDKDAGIVTYIGDKIEFQNGFGAWQGAVYECDFDTIFDQVLSVRAEPGRL